MYTWHQRYSVTPHNSRLRLRTVFQQDPSLGHLASFLRLRHVIVAQQVSISRLFNGGHLLRLPMRRRRLNVRTSWMVTVGTSLLLPVAETGVAGEAF